MSRADELYRQTCPDILDGKGLDSRLHWADGTQPIALSADRKFFRETTRGAMVIGGGSIYRQMLPLCDVQSGEEDGIGYEMCLYKRI